MRDSKEYLWTKYACYTGSAGMAVVSVLSPLLFAAFHDACGISYTRLGLLIAINFLTQLSVDLIFSFFAGHFNIRRVVRLTPVITLVGLLIYGIMPLISPEHVYLWLTVGTVIFSAAAGLGEVLYSPVIAAIPSKDPEREMSTLHSAYAWGYALSAAAGTLLLKLTGTDNWHFLVLLFMTVPLAGAVMFAKAKLPPLNMGKKDAKDGVSFKNKGLLLCVLCIFLGGGTEVTMSEWISSYIESGIGLPKVVGDILGTALFAVMLGIGRSVYARRGKNISSVMLLGMAGAAVCYLTASLCLHPAVSLAACALAGLCVSMLWPGTLIYVEENFNAPGVAVYALLAAGGDLGASAAPQAVGIISDRAAMSAFAQRAAHTLGITPEQVGIRTGMLSAAVFPLLGIVTVLLMKRFFEKPGSPNTKERIDLHV